ncbi:DUF4249 domain-containing protein [Aquimarina hainanensis]|uniref:DUF4249 domain-containing protein n=1 Tax=Aquimarina hainanensis TaxID=1578017 RepID=A0ABW5N3B1_9FLAO|nr:DUF4249 domain-containing protein [Aquimarina sp. TRL1]QKX06011.1 DUF4249 family protein [Aquimarina sp. TRL1]
MKTYIHSLIGTLLLSLLMSSCGEDTFVTPVDIGSFLSTDNEIVITSFIAPQNDLIEVEISKTFPLSVVLNNPKIPEEDFLIKDASVTLKNSKNEDITVPYNPTSKKYVVASKDFPILAGETYTIEVTALAKTATASTTIPGNASTELEKPIIKKEEARFGSSTYLSAEISWKDIASEENFYHVIAIANEDVEDIDNSFEINLTQFDFNHHLFYEEDDFGIEDDTREYISDAGRDGAFLKAKGITGNTREVKKVTVKILTVDKNYFEYHQAIKKQEFFEDEIFVEPITIPSNVNGGKGVFSSYQITEEVFTF